MFFKKLLGLNKTRKSESIGYRLDQEETEELSDALLKDDYEFEVEFTEQILGCVLGKGTDNYSYVFSVNTGTQADYNNLRRGDRIVSIDNVYTPTHDEVVSLLKSSSRPTKITFYRHDSNLRQIVSISTSTQNTNTANSSNVTKSNLPITNNAELEKQRRRELMAKAAEDRAKSWNKRVAAGSSNKYNSNTNITDNRVDAFGKPVYDHSVAASIGNENPDTQRMVEAAKKGEQKYAQNLGIDVYKPQMSFSGNSVSNSMSSGQPSGGLPISKSNSNLNNSNSNSANTSTNSPPPPPSSQSTNAAVTISELTYIIEDDEMIESVDEAFALLLSISAGSNEELESKVNTAIATVLKMLTNLYLNKQEAKFRSVRLMNEAFQNKVIQVSGGLELMLSAGYLVVEEQQQGTESVLFLRHDMSERHEKMLGYALRRILELQE